MKNRFIILIISAVLVLFATSCNKFLDTTPDNRTELDTEEKLRGLLTSAYPEFTYAVITELMGDDHDDIGTDFGWTSVYEQYQLEAWNWRVTTEENGTDSPKQVWTSFYGAIAAANQVLAAIEELGRPKHLDPLRGEALMCRAFCHFRLVNLFCQNYSEEFGNLDLGIPYITEPEKGVNPSYDRGTVAGVYENIERDIEEGLPLISDDYYTVPKYHFNRSAAYGFAAEFYLYYRQSEGTEHLDKVIEYADEVLGSTPRSLLRDVSVFKTLNATLDTHGRAYIDSDVPANLLLMANISTIGYFSSNYDYGKRYLHNILISSAETVGSSSVLWGQNRGGASFIMPFFIWATTPAMYTRLNVWGGDDKQGYPRNVAVEVSTDNVLLNRAEAYILKEDYPSAMRDINLWRSVRIDPRGGDASPKTEEQVANYYGSAMADYTFDKPTPKKKLNPDVPLTTKQESFIHAILHMRRIEFLGEGKRWFDIKRYGIEVTHRQYREPASVTYHDFLGPRDTRRAIQIPSGVIAAGLQPNPR